MFTLRQDHFNGKEVKYLVDNSLCNFPSTLFVLPVKSCVLSYPIMQQQT